MYARLINNVVAEIVTPVPGFTIEECFHPDLTSTMIPCDAATKQGWVLFNGRLVDPVDAETAAQIGAMTQEQIQALTIAEIEGWSAAQALGLTAPQLAEMTDAQRAAVPGYVPPPPPPPSTPT